MFRDSDRTQFCCRSVHPRAGFDGTVQLPGAAVGSGARFHMDTRLAVQQFIALHLNAAPSSSLPLTPNLRQNIVIIRESCAVAPAKQTRGIRVLNLFFVLSDQTCCRHSPVQNASTVNKFRMDHSFKYLLELDTDSTRMGSDRDEGGDRTNTTIDHNTANPTVMAAVREAKRSPRHWRSVRT